MVNHDDYLLLLGEINERTKTIEHTLETKTMPRIIRLERGAVIFVVLLLSSVVFCEDTVAKLLGAFLKVI